MLKKIRHITPKKSSSRHTFTNLLVALSTTLILLFCLELGFRNYYKVWQFSNFTGVGQEYDAWRGNLSVTHHPWQTDPWLGWLPTSRVTTTISGGAPPQVTILEDGIRSNGQEFPSLKKDRPQRPLILAVGDSFTYGDQVADNQTWPAVLEGLSRTNVLNAGVFGYGVDQIFLRAVMLSEKYTPDILIFSFIPEDIFRCEFSISYGVRKPYFTINQEGEFLLKDSPVPAQTFSAQNTDCIRKILGYSFLVHHFMSRINPTYWYTGRQNLRADDRGEAKIPGGLIACLLLQKLADLAQTTPMKIIVLIQYSTFDEDVQLSLLTPVMKCLERSPAKTALYILDLKEALWNVRSRDKATYDSLFYGHMTYKGNQFVAEHLYHFMCEKQLLSCLDPSQN